MVELFEKNKALVLDRKLGQGKMSLKPVCGLNWLERWALHKVSEEKKYYFRTSLTSISSPLLPTCMSLTLGPFGFTHGVLSQSLVSDSLKPHGL